MLGIGGAAGLAGCTSGGGGTDGTTEDQGSNDVGLDEDVEELPSVSGSYDTVTSAGFDTLNPLYNTEAGAGTAIGRTMDTGYTFDEDGEYFPLLYDMSTEDGGNTWVFEIRDGLEFSDPYGQVTADSFVYQIQELHQSDWANTADATNWTGVTVEKTGTLEFQAELASPQLLWPESYDPSLYPIPKELVEPYVKEEDTEGLRQDEELLELKFTGNLGGFVLDNWERSAGTEYSRNDDYYIQNIDEGPTLFEEAPYFESASISVVKEQSSRLGALQSGEADAASIPPARFEEFKQKDLSVFQIPQPYNEIISVNMRDNGWNAGPGNLFRYKSFRQGLACAISKDKLITGVYRGLAKPHFTWQPRFSEFYPEGEIQQFGVGDLYGRDVARERVRTAIDQSEYDYRFDGDALVNPDGDQVTLDIYHSAGQETEKILAEFITQELEKNLGIKVVVEAIEGTRFNDKFWTGTPPEDPPEDAELGNSWAVGPNNPGPRQVTSAESWDMSLVYGLNTFPRNPLTNSVFFDGPDAQYNPVGYYPEFDAAGIIENARQAESVEELKQALKKLFAKLAEEQPYIMLAFPDDLVGYNPALRGPIENFNNGWDFAGWHFEE
jgi:peptide/nickel transport system substrate-binding protein